MEKSFREIGHLKFISINGKEEIPEDVIQDSSTLEFENCSQMRSVICLIFNDPINFSTLKLGSSLALFYLSGRSGIVHCLSLGR